MHGAARPRTPNALHGRVALLLAVLGFFVSFAAAARPLLGDNKNYGWVAQSLLGDGDIRLDEFAASLTGNTRSEDGHIYNYFPLGPSLLALPFLALAQPLASDAVHAQTLAARSVAALCFGASLALFFLVARRFTGVTMGGAALLTLVFGFCSTHFSAHVGQLSSHGTVVPFVLAALLALGGPQPRAPGLAAALLVAAYVMRPTAGLVAPLAAVWLWLYHRTAAFRFLVVAAACGACVLALNRVFYGHVLPPYNSVERLELAGFLHGAAGNLVSPSRGLVFYVPWFVFSIAGAVRSLREPDQDPLFRLLAVIFVALFTVVSCFPQWWAGWCYGPRFLAEAMPELALLALPALTGSTREPSPVLRRRRRVFAALALYAGVVAILGITRPAGDWNRTPVNVDRHPERLWDFSDPQILRPLRGAPR